MILSKLLRLALVSIGIYVFFFAAILTPGQTISAHSIPGSNDTMIPAIVAQAVNFYQPHGLVHGDHGIRAADPAHTRIIGNFQFEYKTSSLKCSGYPWYDRIFVKPHTQIECDPMTSDRVESLI